MGTETETGRLKRMGSHLARSSLSLTRYISTAGPGLTMVVVLLVLHLFQRSPVILA
jgi:hypothetical protein